MSRTTLASAMAATSSAASTTTTATSLASSHRHNNQNGGTTNSSSAGVSKQAANTKTSQGVVAATTFTTAPSSSSAATSTACFLSPATSHRVVQTTAHLMNAGSGPPLDLPLESDTTTPSNCSSQHYLLPQLSQEDRKRKAAAAAARRKRRKALLQKAHHHQQQQVQTTTLLLQPSPQPSPRSVSQQPTAPQPPLMLVEKKQPPCQERPLVVTRTTSRTVATLPIQPTVQGILDIVQRWKVAISPVAIPTECTYEACIAIQQKDQIDGDCSTRTRIALLQHASGILAVPTILVPPPNKNKTVLDLPFFRPHFAPRIYAVATPSTTPPPQVTTTTTARPKAPLPRNVMPPTRTSSSLSCTSASSCTSRVSCSSTVLVQHAFNENAQVLQRLSAKLWPGPVVIHVSAASPSQPHGQDQQQQQQHDLLYEEFQGTSFIALRSPRHPLAVRLVKEFYRGNNVGDIDGTIHTSDKDNTKKTLPAGISWPSLSLPILVSLPIHASHVVTQPSALPALTNNNEYCTTAAQVIHQSEAASTSSSTSSIAAVLQGEERREMFAVPTCEYAAPWPVEVYIHGPHHRTVTIMHRQKKGVGGSGALQQKQEELLQETASLVSAALYPTKKPTTFKEGMILAVLRKWKVVTTTAD